jgi:predicted enzyme related to lactoylglutathione lyase
MMAKMVSDSWVMAEAKYIPRSVAFYAKLGLKPSMQRTYYAEFKVPGGTVLGLHSMGHASSGRQGKTALGWRIMLRVPSIKRVVARLKRQKVRCTAVKRAPGGAYFSSLTDPDGNRLTLIQMG